MPGSLRYAITQANLPGNAGSIVKITNQVTGPIDLTAGELPLNASMTIRNDSGAPVEIRQATANARVLHIGSNAATVTITGVSSATSITLDGGSVTGANGGGILVYGTTDLKLPRRAKVDSVAYPHRTRGNIHRTGTRRSHSPLASGDSCRRVPGLGRHRDRVGDLGSGRRVLKGVAPTRCGGVPHRGHEARRL
jgi:hypothetical protein